MANSSRQLTKAEKAELAGKCFRSPSEFCRIFLPDWFPTKMPWVHRGILALRLQRTDFLLDFGEESWRDGVDTWGPEDLQKLLTNFLEEGTGRPIFELTIDETGHAKIEFASFVKNNLAIIMPRGFSKTTVMNAANLIDILYKSMDFFLYVSEASGHAERQLGTIKEQIGDEDGVPNNPIIYEVFGAFQPSRSSQLKWTENFIETLGRIRVGAIGRGGKIRGFNKNAIRPGNITFDDLEDEDSVRQEDQRKKDSKWFFGTAMPTVRKGGRLMVIGTLLHPTDAILNKCVISREFTAVRFGAIDRQGDPLWPFMMSLEEIENKKLAFTEVGQLQAFYLEYMSEWKEDDTQMFPSSLLVYAPKGCEHFVCMALAQDPAISEAGNADFASFAVTGMENGGRKHVVDWYGKQGMDAADQIEKFFELHFQWLCRVPAEWRRHGIEAVAFQRALIGLVRQQQYEKSKTYGVNAYFEVMPILHGKTGKMARVQGMLKPLLKSKYLTFETMWPVLHTQFVEWPSNKLDGPDSVAMSLSLLDPFSAITLETPDAAPENGALIIPNQHVTLPALGEWRSAP